MKLNRLKKGLLSALSMTMIGLYAAPKVMADGGAPQVDVASEIGKYIGYDKGVFIKTPDDKFKMKFNVQLQPQFQFLELGHQPDAKSFQMRRARFYISGYAFNPNLTYKMESEFVGGRANNTAEGVPHTGFNVREAYLNYKFNDHFEIRGGEFKVFNNREELTSSTQFQFVDQSINNDVFTLSYDLGLGILGKFGPGDKFEYGLYTANEGNNRNTFDFNNELLFGGRLTYNILGNHGYTQGAVDNPEDPQLAVGVGGSWNRPGMATVAGVEQTIIGATGDVAFRYKRFSFMGEGNFARNHTAKLNIFGLLGQVGYFLVPKHFEVAGRVAAVIPTASVASATNGYEVGGDLNYYFYGHNVKLQADYAALIHSPLTFGGGATAKDFMTTGVYPGFKSTQTDHRIRIQAQLYF